MEKAGKDHDILSEIACVNPVFIVRKYTIFL